MRSLLRWLILSIVLVAAANPELTLAQGTVQGIVTDSRNGQPVSGALLRLGYSALGSWSPTSGISAAVSGADGRYAFSMVPVGSYLMKIEPAPPLLPEFWPDIPCYPGPQCSVGLYAGVVVANGATFVADVSLGTAGRISGEVRALAGSMPVPLAEVTAYRPSGSGYVLVQGTTGIDGRYQFDGVPPGPYRVYVDGGPNYIREIYDDIPCSFNCQGGDPAETIVTAVSDQDVSGIDFALAAAGRITGTVRNTGGTGLAHPIGIALYRLSGGQLAIVNSQIVQGNDAGGAFAFDALNPGAYVLRTYYAGGAFVYAGEVYQDRDCAADDCTPDEVAQGTPIALAPAQVVTGLDLQVDPAASISGCVQGPLNQALSAVDVVAYAWRPLGFGFGYVNVGATRTGIDGCYRLDYLATNPGDLRLRTHNSAGFADEVYGGGPCLGGTCALGIGATIAVPHDADLSGYSFTLGTGPAIDGILIGTPGGRGIPNVELEFYSGTGVRLRAEDGALLRTRPDGRFTTYAFADGTYFLAWSIVEGAYAGRYVLGLARTPFGEPWPDPTLGTPLTISGAQGIAGLEIVAEPNFVHTDGFE